MKNKTAQALSIPTLLTTLFTAGCGGAALGTMALSPADSRALRQAFAAADMGQPELRYHDGSMRLFCPADETAPCKVSVTSPIPQTYTVIEETTRWEVYRVDGDTPGEHYSHALQMLVAQMNPATTERSDRSLEERAELPSGRVRIHCVSPAMDLLISDSAPVCEVWVRRR